MHLPDHIFLYKVLLALVLAIANLGLYRWVMAEKANLSHLKWAVLVIFGLKAAGIIFIYGIYPHFHITSDSNLFYLPYATDILHGKVPERDFALPYSFFFPYLLALPVWLWHSAGAICLLMTAIEALMIWRFIRVYDMSPVLKYRTAILYLSTYMSFYFVSFTGYNGIIICCALVFCLAYQSPDRQRGWQQLFFQLGFWLSKLLMLLYLPVLVFVGKPGIKSLLKRAATLLLIPAFLLVLALVGIPIAQPIYEQGYSFTACNLPFFVWLAFPGLDIQWFTLIDLGILCAAVVLISYYYLRVSQKHDNYQAIRLCFAAALTLVFLLLSKKAFVQYLEMSYFIMLAALLLLSIKPFKFILLLNLMNILYPIELYLEGQITDHQNESHFKVHGLDSSLLPLILVDITIMGIYVYLLVSILRFVRPGKMIPINSAP